MADWTWEKATPRERGAWVRHSFGHCLSNIEKLCDLFNLTENGARKILNGDDWKAEYQNNT